MNFLSIISKHRGELMGVAAVWVIIFHLYIAHYVNNSIVSFFCGIGNSGVDIFLFLSGFGLYYSSKNKKQTKIEFYKRRLFKIGKTYIPFALIGIIICLFVFDDNMFGMGNLLLRFSTIDFWFMRGSLYWYVAAILVFYFFYPYLLKPCEERPVSTLIILFAVSIVLTVCETYIDGWRILFTARIPIFFIGVVFGKLSLDKELKNPERIQVMLLVSMFIGLSVYYVMRIRYSSVIREYSLTWYYACLYLPGLILVLCYFFRFTASKLNVINKLALFFGQISLEIYLFHILFFYYKHHIINMMGWNLKTTYAGCIVGSTVLSYMLSKTVQLFETKFRSRTSL